MRLLLVEDDRRLSRSLKMSLIEEGYAVDAAFDGDEGEAFAELGPYDAIILDVMLPRKDGVAVCRSLRLHKVNIPILMLTARDAVEDRVSAHLFERFYRVDQSRTHSQELVPGAVSCNGLSAGSGLGLSIARWIAQAHGGDIQVQSIVGLGAVFAIWLPLPGNKPTCE